MSILIVSAESSLVLLIDHLVSVFLAFTVLIFPFVNRLFLILFLIRSILVVRFSRRIRTGRSVVILVTRLCLHLLSVLDRHRHRLHGISLRLLRHLADWCSRNRRLVCSKRHRCVELLRLALDWRVGKVVDGSHHWYNRNEASWCVKHKLSLGLSLRLRHLWYCWLLRLLRLRRLRI